MRIAYSQDPNLVVNSDNKDLIFDLANKNIYAHGTKFTTLAETDTKIIRTAVVIDSVENNIAVVTDTQGNEIYPQTTADAVIMGGSNLTNYLEQNKIILDERPTKNSTNGVQSGGIYAELEEVVGVIYTNLKQI